MSHSRDNSFVDGKEDHREEESGDEDKEELTGRTKVGKIVGEVITRAK